MPRVFLKGTDKLIAESDKTEVVEGNHYFPPDSLKDKNLFKDSPTSTGCPWKGQASYYNFEGEGASITDVAWYYPTPKEAAKNIKGYVAFYKNKVDIKD